MAVLRWFLLFFGIAIYSQGLMLQESRKTVIPFRLINNLIFVPVTVNGVELTFLLDSGVAETLLFSLEDKEIDFRNTEKMNFTGLGENTQIEGLKAVNNQITIGKNFSDPHHSIYIILDETFNFSSHVGIPVNGIIGYYFFRNHPLKIDFIRKKITIYPKDHPMRKETKGFQQFPISIELKKPYIQTTVQQINDRHESKMLIDIGNSDALWLFPSLIPGFRYNRPNIDDYLGRGFNGDIYGKRSRINKLYIGTILINRPVAAMPDAYSIQHLQLVKDRKGSVGTEILRRFQIITDYPGGHMYLKKNRHFSDPFHINMSGLELQQDGMQWEQDLVKVTTPLLTKGEAYSSSRENEFKYRFVLKPLFSVAGVRKNSPAALAGMQKDDRLLEINKTKTSDLTLDKINKIFQAHEGSPITIKADRKGKEMLFRFILQDPIPYQENE